MAGIDRLAEVMGVENDFDPVSQSKFLYEVADEIERIRAALANARAEERERCARVAEEKWPENVLWSICGKEIAAEIRKLAI